MQLRGDGTLFIKQMFIAGDGEVNSANMTTLTLQTGGITVNAGGVVVSLPVSLLKYLTSAMLRCLFL